MDALRATSELEKSRFSRITWVSETTSTNQDLLEAARSDAPEQVLGADYQSAGRGRLGRVWEAGAGTSVLCSILVRPPAGLDEPHLVTTALGLAAAEAIEEVTGRTVGIKWPNDLVAGTAVDPDDRKLAGILAETTVDHGAISAIVVGIGINTNWPDDLPAELAATATSLRHLIGREVDRTDLVIAMLRRLDVHLGALESTEVRQELRRGVESRSATVGRRVRIERVGDDLVGDATGLAADGRLLVTNDEGEHIVSVGDAVHLRPTD